MSQAVKVGIFGTIALIIAALFIWRIEDINPFARGAQRVDAMFNSVAGLDDKAAVRVAGVRVGRVDGIGLDGGRARVTLLLERPVALTAGARARIANLGLLGDKYVELVPGPEGGAAAARGRGAAGGDAGLLRPGDGQARRHRQLDPGGDRLAHRRRRRRDADLPAGRHPPGPPPRRCASWWR